MPIWNIVHMHEIRNRVRIEAEFYRPEYSDCQKTVESVPHTTLGLSRRLITDGTHFTPRYMDAGVRFYSAVNVKDGYFAHDGPFKFISGKEHRAIHKRCPVKAGDVLLRKVGVGPRWSCVVPKGLEEFSIFVSVALIRTTDVILPEYLSTFMNCRYGQLQLLRLNKGISQPDLHLEDISELVVPLVQNTEQQLIADYVRQSQIFRDRSRTLYQEAQQFLEAELRLDKLTFERPVGHTAHFSTVGLSDTFSTGRIDAQCFAPEALFYERWLLTHVRCDRLGKVVRSTAKGRQQVELSTGPTDYCSIKHIVGREVVEAAKCIPTPDTPLAGSDDLLLAITGATIGKIGIVKRYESLAFSGDLLCLRTSEAVNPHYLLLVLDHHLGQVQFNRWITGSTNGHLGPRDIARVLVPRLKSETEAEIAALVKSAISKRRESEQLLEQAKARVEQLIEEAVQP